MSRTLRAPRVPRRALDARRALAPRRAAALLTAAALVAVGAVTLTSANADPVDTQAPTIASYRVLPTSVDDTAGDRTATVVVRIQDGAQAGATPSGFSNGTVTLTSATSTNPGTTLDPVGFTDSDRVSGTPYDGTYDIDVPVPQGTAAGAYTASLYLEDFAGANATVANATPLTVRRANDTAAPTLGQLTASASTVDVTAGDRRVTYTAQISDALSGATAARLTVTGPDSTDTLDLDRTSGTAQNGVWTGIERYSSYSTPGTYSITAITLTDAFGNTATTTGLTGAPVTVKAAVDTTKPKYTANSLTLDRTNVDVSDGAKTVHVTIAATDDLSGVAAAHVTFVGSDGYSQADADLTQTGGTVTNGVWSGDVSFDTPATYTLSQLILTDAQYNTTTLCTPQTPADPYDTAPPSSCDGAQPAAMVTVTSTDDSTAPVVSNLKIGPSTVTSGYLGVVRIDGSFDVSDAVSGFAGATVTLTSNSGATWPIYVTPYDLVSGDVHKGTVLFSTYMYVTGPGTWTVSSMSVSDLDENTGPVSTAGSGSITVSTTRGDTQAPVLTGVTVTPNPVNTTSGAQTVTVTASLNDSQADGGASGVTDTTVTLASPSGVRTDVDVSTLTSGDDVKGTWSGTTTLGQYAEPGTWTIAGASTTDAAGLSRSYATGSAPLAGTFTVQSATDGTAPVLTGLSVPSTTFDTAGADRSGLVIPVHVKATDTGSGIDDVTVTLAGPYGLTASATTPVDNTLALDTDVLVTVPAFNAGGGWSVTGVDLLSDRGPDGHWTSASPNGLGATFTLSTPTDDNGPAVAELAITPSAISTRAATVSADVLVHLTDDGSGTTRAAATLTSPKGYQTLSTALTLVAGDAGDGWWQGSIRLPRYVDPGDWRISLTARNALNHGTDMSSAKLATAGLPSTVNVTGVLDNNAPQLTNLTLNHSTLSSVDFASGGWLIMSLTATDDASGVAAVEVTLKDPNGVSQTVVGSPVASSTPTDASYVAAVPLSSLATVGTWRVSAVAVTDLAGNRSTTADGQLAAYATTFVVTDAPGTPPATTTPPPVPPTNVTAILAGGTTATVTWTAPSSTVKSYTVTPYRDGAAQATVAASTTSATFTGLARGASYTFAVRAVNDAGSSAAAVPDIGLYVPAVAPSAPSVGTATVSGTTATVPFTAPADDGGAEVTSYRVTPWLDGTAGTPVVVTGNATAATLTGLQRGRAYSFTVAARNNVNWSPQSSASNTVAVAAIAPSAPAGLSATVSGTTATLSWSAPIDDGGAAITGFVLSTKIGSAPATTSPLDASATTTTVTGLPIGTAVSFSAMAVNAVGQSAPATASVTVPVPARTATTLTVTSAPTSLTYGSALPVTGRLTSPDKAGKQVGLAGRSVSLQYRRHGVGGYVTFGTARTATDGSVRFTTFKPGYSVDVRLAYAGEGAGAQSSNGLAAATSAARAVGEYARISIAATSKVRKGKTFTVYGSVSPNKYRHVVYLQRRSGSRWVTVTHQTLSSHSGYRFTVRASSRGTFGYRVYYGADGYQASTGSASKSVRVY
ncbi:beta strand repeat-containing protein [uncultured Jatrophihabitans sp.]|uniref:beta strand repeat-containing protein n=1 Tax=uncultured Jatrophihabitans sp. TaxID=1610747 RepID=UPI0035CB166F